MLWWMRSTIRTSIWEARTPKAISSAAVWVLRITPTFRRAGWPLRKSAVLPLRSMCCRWISMENSRRYAGWRFGACVVTLAGLGLLALSPVAAQNENDAESKLRSALRSATVELRQLQDQNATLQAKQAEWDRDRKA